MRKKSKKKAMKAIWDDSSRSETEHDDQGEISYMCYMAIDD